MTLKTRNAIVTGSTSGIGLAIARGLAAEGANVVINGFGDADAIEKERKAIEKDFGVKSIYSPADGTKPDAVRGMVKQAEADDGINKTEYKELATLGFKENSISPGYVWTPLVEKQIPDTMKARNLTREQVIQDVLLKAQPTKEFVTVDQVAALAVFLCSDAAAQITGANLSIDGGWTAE